MAPLPAVDTECSVLSYSLEDSNGAPTGFKKILPSDVTRLGKSNELTPPDVIDGSRQRITGKITRQDAGADYTGPVSMSSAGDFLYAALYRDPASVKRNQVVDVAISAKNTTGYTLSFGTTAEATAALKLLNQDVILYVTGHDDLDNDGYKFINGAPAQTNNTIRVPTTLAAGSATVANLRASIAGILMPASTITSWVTTKDSNDMITGTMTFASAAAAQVFVEEVNSKSHFLVKDQPVHIGHYIDGAITDTLQANGVGYGYAVFDRRSGSTLVFKECSPELEVASSVNLVRNVSLMCADYATNTKGCVDPDFMAHQFTVQEKDPAEGSRADSYTYVTGAEVNTLSFDFSDNALASMSVALVGRDAEQTSTAKTGGDAPVDGAYPDVMNSSADFARFGIKSKNGSDRGSAVDRVSFTLNNNVTARSRAGKLAALQLAKGQFQADVSITAVFTNPEILDDVYNSVPGTVRLISYCFDGALYFYTPNTVFGNGARTRARQNSKTIQIDGQANKSGRAQGEYSIGIGRFFGDFRTVEDF